MLPVNQPKCPFHNNHEQGAMNFMHKSEEVRDKWLFVAFGGFFWQELKPLTDFQVINEGHHVLMIRHPCLGKSDLVGLSWG
jgi:hypothetical protein